MARTHQTPSALRSCLRALAAAGAVVAMAWLGTLLLAAPAQALELPGPAAGSQGKGVLEQATEPVRRVAHAATRPVEQAVPAAPRVAATVDTVVERSDEVVHRTVSTTVERVQTVTAPVTAPVVEKVDEVEQVLPKPPVEKAPRPRAEKPDAPADSSAGKAAAAEAPVTARRTAVVADSVEAPAPVVAVGDQITKDRATDAVQELDDPTPLSGVEGGASSSVAPTGAGTAPGLPAVAPYGVHLPAVAADAVVGRVGAPLPEPGSAPGVSPD